MTLDFSTRANLLNVREERRGMGGIEFRKDKASGQYILEGYAATYEPYDVHGGPPGGGWVEQLSSKAFDNTLASQPDVQLLINHEGAPLARTTSGTLKLSRDGHGLRVWASLDPSDPDVQRLAPKMLRKDMTEMSFAFRVQDQDWDSSYTNRTINALSLEKGDVSVVNYGMNPGTRAVLSADAVGALAQLSSKELVEMRNLDFDQVRRAQAALNKVIEMRKGDEPDGDVKYADPGYKADGKKRYPINDKDRAKSAWSYINMPKNHKGYTAAQVASIKSRIKSALKEFGVTVSDKKDAAGLSHIDMQHNRDGGTTLVAVMADGSRVPLPSQQVSAGDMVMYSAPTPADMPQPDADPPGRWTPAATGWNPNAPNQDPHDHPYDEGTMGKPSGFGPVPDNIVGGVTNHEEWLPDASEWQPRPGNNDPHDVPCDERDADPHDDPYNVGPQAGGAMPGEGPVPPNIHAGADCPPENDDDDSSDFMMGGKVRPPYGPGAQVPANPVIGSPQSGLNRPVPGSRPSLSRSEGLYDWTNGPITPGNPPEDLDAPAQRPSIGMKRGIAVVASDPHDTPTGADHGYTVGLHGTSGSWAPTNIWTSSGPYDPETGEGSVPAHDGVDDDSEAVENPNTAPISLSLAEALDRTIVHAYQMSKGNTELRKVLAMAWRQLNEMRGVKAPRNTDVSRRLMQLRREVGTPDTGTVSDCLKYLRNASSAPIGYGGVLSQEPGCRVVTAAERVAREATVKARRAATESDTAKARLKAAQREAQLNAVIARPKPTVKIN